MQPPLDFLKSACLSLVLCGAWHTSHADDRFVVSSDGAEVTDSTTGLTWRRCSEGQVWAEDHCAGRAREYNHRAAMALAPKPAERQPRWRAPTMDELASLINKESKPVAVDLKAFPDTAPSRYWSSTRHHTDASTQVMVAYFNDGHIAKYHKNNKAHLRLVRD